MSRINYNESYRTTGGLQRFDCLAWVNFNGTGTVAIRASGNVSSITDNNTGDYTVNFTNALPDANYTMAASRTYTSNYNVPATLGLDIAVGAKTSSTQRVYVAGPNTTSNVTWTPVDPIELGLAFFR